MKNVTQKQRRPGKRHDSAAKATLEAARADMAAARGGEPGSAADVDFFNDALRRAANIRITITLEQACKVIGDGVEPHRFAATAFEAIAEDLAIATDMVATSPNASEGWRLMAGMANRVRFAAEIERRLST